MLAFRPLLASPTLWVLGLMGQHLGGFDRDAPAGAKGAQPPARCLELAVARVAPFVGGVARKVKYERLESAIKAIVTSTNPLGKISQRKK